MSLTAATIGPKSFHRHLVAYKERRTRGRRSVVLALMLTPMVDMFSLLVIFLLQVFSASPDFLITPGVVLPNSLMGHEIKDAPVLSLTDKDVFLDEKLIGTIDEVLAKPEGLMTELETLRKKWQELHTKEEFLGEINLEAHKDLPSTTVSQFMGMLPSQHFGSIQLVTVAGSTSGGKP